MTYNVSFQELVNCFVEVFTLWGGEWVLIGGMGGKPGIGWDVEVVLLEGDWKDLTSGEGEAVCILAYEFFDCVTLLRI